MAMGSDSARGSVMEKAKDLEMVTVKDLEMVRGLLMEILMD